MTKDTMLMQQIIAAQDADEVSKCVLEATNDAYNVGCGGIGQKIKDVFAECHTSREFDMVNQTVEAITGLPIQSLIEEEEGQEVM